MSDVLNREKLLVIGEQSGIAEYLRQRYPDVEVQRVGTVLEGIDLLNRQQVRGVLTHVTRAAGQLRDAIAGLREAAGERTRVLLCCAPEDETEVRRVVDAGADDYLLWPPIGGEVDAALDFETATASAAAPPVAAPGTDELQQLAAVVEALEADPYALLCRLADLVRLAMGSEAVTLVLDGSAVSSGGTVVDAVLIEPIERDGHRVGQISVGPRTRAYLAQDATRLRQYASIVSHVVTAATRQRRWRREAMTDDVSGLYNRRYVRQFLDDLLVRARKERFRVTVLLFDIDDFKSYNDHYGHAAGDDVIACIGKLFKSHCREHDVVARYGGDEFCVVFWDLDQPRIAGSEHPTDALNVLSRFREALQNYHCKSLHDQKPGQLTISGGLASYPWDAADRDELLARADEALLRAKSAGKNQVLVFGAGHSSDPA
jgi:diguanylate cyclase (GGDEF)-like protein